MSDLATVSAEIAPYLTMAANSLGTSVISAAQQRIAERTVTAGEGFFRRLLRRGDGADGDPVGDGGRLVLDRERADDLDGRLAALGDDERRVLAEAVGAWLAGPADRRDGSQLLRQIERLAGAAGGRTVHHHVTATGQGSIAAGEIHGDIHMGGSADSRNGS
ncbi:hypothetical protein [Streptomyces endophytica]|uniref:Uncharacterized protein n=1 Tax=Streptomyces endophytica TaxID=2991496 RepID=A0ABY6PCW3_9ACTN|nr:hypothetical protein [Streptomyces endophytica]UZJ31621.1 hypothetical protein OJ254_16665 [Streptomyces endophytica]